LQGFYSEKDERQKHFEALKAKAEDDADDRQWSIEDWGEDWQISQFWVSLDFNQYCISRTKMQESIQMRLQQRLPKSCYATAMQIQRSLWYLHQVCSYS